MERNEYIVAIDLGTSKVATLVGRKVGTGRVEILASSVSDSLMGIVRGEIKNTEHISKALKETIENIETELNISIKEAYIGISGQHIKCSRHTGYIFIENNDSEVRERDVQRLNESMNNIQIPVGETIIHILPQEYKVDDEPGIREPVGMIGNKLEAIFNIITGDRNAISRVDKCLSKLNVNVKQHILNPLAAAEAVLIPDEKELGVAVVDIGGGTTDICIYHDNIVRHVAIIPLGGNIINKDIRSYGILERRVESLKVKFGSAVGALERADKFITIPGLNARDPKEISCRNLASIIEARMLDVIDCVNFEIKKAGFEDKLGAGIVLTGGCSQLRNLDVLFREHTGYDVRVAIPDTHVTESSVELVNSPAYTAAVGLLLKAVGEGVTMRVEPSKRTTVATNPQATVRVPPPRPVPDTETPPTPQPPRGTVGRSNWNRPGNRPQDTPFTDDTETETEEKPKNWWQRAKERLTNTFEVIDDDI